MATAYLALQESLGREVVLKVLDTRNVANSDMVERFMAEGRIVASLNHPNIITIYDIGIAEDNLYISMEYVQGGDLKQRIKKGVPPDDVLDYMAQLTSGLQAAHKRNIIHRDIKPANILFRQNGTPLITDFGIAKQTSLDSELTSTGMFLGSPNYVSPEQADGHEIDGRSDIYSLGCVLFEMLTGSKPYSFSSVIDIVIQHKQAPVPNLPEELAEFQPLIDRMMAKQCSNRFTDSAALLEAIESLRNQRRERLQRQASISQDRQPGQHSHRRPLIRVLIVLLILSAGFLGAMFFVDARLNQETDRASTASTRSVLLEEGGQAVVTPADTETATAGENRQEVIRALNWLGRQSLEEYKLTYPPRDNAYYYFTKLLELEPGSEQARQGISNIADRYAILAEQALARDEIEKTQTYVGLGLKIDPDNKTLLSLQSLVEQEDEQGWMEVLKGLFGQS